MRLRELLRKVYGKARSALSLISSGDDSRRLFSLTRTMAADKLNGRKVIIVFVEEPGFVQFLLPIVEELKRRAGASISLYMATEHSDRSQALAPFGVPPERTFHPRLAPALLLADVFLSASVYGKGPRTSLRINTSHNQPTKFEAYPKEFLRNYNVHFLTGPLHREQYEHMFALHGLDTTRFKLQDIGYPKSDKLLQGAYARGRVLKELGLNPARKTVLYAPAWDAGGSLRCFGDKVIEQLLSLGDVNVITKLHPISYTPSTSSKFEWYTGGVDWIERFKRFAANPRFRHVTNFQVDPLLVASDALVTDFSSVALEFIVLDKPVLYLDCPEYFEKTLKLPAYNSDPDYVRNNPRANAGRHVGVVVDHVSDLATAVARSLANPLQGSEKRRELAKMLLYNPGKGAETAAAAILDMLGVKT
jgi:CDP-glycerol glycerophosphotransferase